MSSRSRTDPNFLYGEWLASPPPGEEVVITGMAGRLPESLNIHHFRDNLFTKKEMVTDDDRRWKLDHPEIPQSSSKIFDIDKYDTGFFGVHPHQAHLMDPMMRVFMETVIEAIMDAGINPYELKGTRTAVVFSSSWSDYEHTILLNFRDRFIITGYMLSLIGQRISYCLNLKGPCLKVDTACSSYLNAVDTAFKYIRSGKCDNAIVGCGNLLAHPNNTLQFFRLGLLSKTGHCKVFDQNADGYVRGEAVGCLILQKAKDARRIYAQVVNTKVNSNGFREQGITFPSTLAQTKLMTEIYEESGIHPSMLKFMEAHGTGTQVGDPQEVEAIDVALAQKREKQLMIGAVKCSIGHTEPSSGLCSIIKILLAMETGIIAPNINLERIKKGLTGIEEGRMKVVTELTKLEGDDAIVGINNFGFGGNNVHIILKRHPKVKVNKGSPEDELPRLVCVSARTEHALEKLLNDINFKSLDREYVSLLHQIYKINIKNHMFRGYTILSKQGPLETSVSKITRNKPLYIHFGEIENELQSFVDCLQQFPCGQSSIEKLNKALTMNNLETFDIIIKSERKANSNLLSVICIQLALLDMLKTLNVIPNEVFGSSYGKLTSAYHYGLLSLEEVISAGAKLTKENLSIELEAQKEQKFVSMIKINKENRKNSAELELKNFLEKNKNTFVVNISHSYVKNENVVHLEDGFTLLRTLGRLFELGKNPHIQKLYPVVEYPVSRGTEMISPSVEWNHANTWYTYKYNTFKHKKAIMKQIIINKFNDAYKYIEDHVIDGRNLFPATEYLNYVWQTLVENRRVLQNDTPVIFKNCKFVKAVTKPTSGIVSFFIKIQRGSGKFEVLENESLVVTGEIHQNDNIDDELGDLVTEKVNEYRGEILEKDEIYRELYLRGYNYRGIEKANVDGTWGLIKWENNWTSFMDKMLQMAILRTDSRLLYVPVSIKKIAVNPAKHLKLAESYNQSGELFPAYVNDKTNSVRSGFIEITGLQARSITRKKLNLEPVLEKHVFVPNCNFLQLTEAIRVNTQIILENNLEKHFKAVELVDPNFSNTDLQLLLPMFKNVVEDIPMIVPQLTVSAKNAIESIPGIKIENVILLPDSNIHLVIVTRVLERTNALNPILKSLTSQGFILTREKPDTVVSKINSVEVVTEYTTPNEKLVLLKKTEPAQAHYLHICSTNLEWLPKLQLLLTRDENVVLYSYNKSPEGILGLVNCIRREPKGRKVNCFFMMDEVPKFDPQIDFYASQIAKNLAVNIFKNGKWGSYRHLLLENQTEIECEHCYANVLSRGDLSTFRWLEGPLNCRTPLQKNQELVTIYYSVINFKDIMVASGRVNIEHFTTNRIEQDCPLGFEFAGRDSMGRKVIGMNTVRSYASQVVADKFCLWEIPEDWRLDDAASVPIVYATVIYSLIMIKGLREGSSIIIHSATGGVGLAAINVCLHFKCNIFLTVGTQEKREFLKKHFPQIPETHIGNSRDTSFEEMIKVETNGRGVDIVLNSLSDDKLKASVRCLAQGGRFMEIGKFDLGNDTPLQLLFMKKNASFHGVLLDKLLFKGDNLTEELNKAIKKGIKEGYVKPLPKTVFDKDDIEKAHRYLMTGNHIGKVIIKIREEEEERVVLPSRKTFKACPRFHCDPTLSYIILGGLGGVGLELADWLVIRGAKKLILVSRSGIQSGYQKQRIQIWRNNYDVDVQVSVEDVTTLEGCTNLIKQANDLGPVDGIFNLAVVLKDALFEDQQKETFVAALAPKAQTTIHLDEVTRKMCPHLRYFVVFSSVSCGRGNIGQTNYGMANSIMERICEKRKDDGYPAIAIQWGAIGEVGLVAKMQKENKELVIGGTLQQRISSCMEVLDKLLRQDNPIVSSMVVVEKSSQAYGDITAVEAVANVLGIKNMKTVSQHVSLAELGMDSLMATEIIQILEKDYDIYVTPKEIRSLTFAKIIVLENNLKGDIEQKQVKEQKGNIFFIQNIPENSDNTKTIHLPNQLKEGEEGPIAFVLPGIESSFKILQTLTKTLRAKVIGLQYNNEQPEETMNEIAQNLVTQIETHLPKNQQLLLITYSFGAAVGLEIMAQMEEKGHRGHLILVDGSPAYLKSLVTTHFPIESEEALQTALLCQLLSIVIPTKVVKENAEKLLKCPDLDSRINFAASLKESKTDDIQKKTVIALLKRIKAVKSYVFEHHKIESKVYLFKAQHPLVNNFDDHQLSSYCKAQIHAEIVTGDHVTILEQEKLHEAVNNILHQE